MTKFTIYKHPISVDNMYGQTKTGRRFLKKEGVKYKEHIAELIRKHHQVFYWGELGVMIKYYFPNKLRRDVTNYDKALLDAMTKVLYDDDSQIVKITLEKLIDRDHPRTEVVIQEINTAG